jgi:hypothetical protein
MCAGKDALSRVWPFIARRYSYNPRKPGRPSHSYHTDILANPRLVPRVDVLP